MVLYIDLLMFFLWMFDGVFMESILGKGIVVNFFLVKIYDLCMWIIDKYKMVDDCFFGGGVGMVMKLELVFVVMEQFQMLGCCCIYFMFDGVLLMLVIVQDFVVQQYVIFFSGYYEGIDQCICDKVIDQEISIGDYVFINGIFVVVVVIDVLSCFIFGVLGEEKLLMYEFYIGMLFDFF